jgi:hypothetical protein
LLRQFGLDGGVGPIHSLGLESRSRRFVFRLGRRCLDGFAARLGVRRLGRRGVELAASESEPLTWWARLPAEVAGRFGALAGRAGLLYRAGVDSRLRSADESARLPAEATVRARREAAWPLPLSTLWARREAAGSLPETAFRTTSEFARPAIVFLTRGITRGAGFSRRSWRPSFRGTCVPAEGSGGVALLIAALRSVLSRASGPEAARSRAARHETRGTRAARRESTGTRTRSEPPRPWATCKAARAWAGAEPSGSCGSKSARARPERPGPVLARSLRARSLEALATGTRPERPGPFESSALGPLPERFRAVETATIRSRTLRARPFEALAARARPERSRTIKAAFGSRTFRTRTLESPAARPGFLPAWLAASGVFVPRLVSTVRQFSFQSCGLARLWRAASLRAASVGRRVCLRQGCPSRQEQS